MQTVGLEQVVQEVEQGSQAKLVAFQKVVPEQSKQVVTRPVVEHVWQLGIMVVQRLHPLVKGL